MLARIRLDFLSVVPLLLIGAAVCAPAWGQIHGVAPSVTSFGFGGSNNPAPGVPASVTSLGPNGFGDGPFIFGNCCFGPNFGLSFGPNLTPNFRQSHPPLFNGRREHHHHDFPVGTIMPVYVPYAIPVAGAQDEASDDEGADVDSSYSRGGPAASERAPWYHDAPANREVDSKPASATRTNSTPVGQEPPAPVAPQPPTVLVFKDGHKSEVQNYAIVGDTLFDFGDGRTHKIQLADLDVPATQKANDDRGVEFELPQKAKNGKAK